MRRRGPQRRNPSKLEDYAYVIDVVRKYVEDPRTGQVREVVNVYAVGDRNFTLLELTPRPNVDISIGEKVYIGKELERREKISKVKRKIFYEDLPDVAKDSLRGVIETIVRDQEKRFIRFLNTAGALNLRKHTLELLPGIGKKILQEILEERKKKPFESFEDFKKRIKGVQDPVKMFTERILMEMLEEQLPERLFTHYQRKPAPRSTL